CRALWQQILITRVRLFRSGIARVLPHGPKPAAIHIAANAARVREPARIAEVAIVFNLFSVRWIVIDRQFDAGRCREVLAAFVFDPGGHRVMRSEAIRAKVQSSTFCLERTHPACGSRPSLPALS